MRFVLAALLALILVPAAQAQDSRRPNILWISTEDMSPNVASFGDLQAHTPNLDRLAGEGVRYVNSFATAPVCAPARSAIITGVYATSLGSHNMRSTARLPESVHPFPYYLRQAGYYTSNNSKEDYNFKTPKDVWDESSGKAHWRKRPDKAQPFFAVFNINTTHESRIWQEDTYNESIKGLTPEEILLPENVILPPFYPDTPLIRRDVARYYNTIAAMDRQVAAILRELKEDGLEDETIVFFFGDHGMGLPRGKRWLYETGTKAPLIVRIPARYRQDGQGKPGAVANELVSFVDLAPTVLRLAGIPIPDFMQGRAFLGPDPGPERRYVYAARDRMDERYDMVRSVRDDRFKYIRYYESYRPASQYMNTPENTAVLQELRRVHEAGEMPPPAQHILRQSRPPEELFDVLADPYELHNLADDPNYRSVLDRMRAAHEAWAADTRDVGLIPEAEIRRMEAETGLPIYDLARRNEGLPLAKARVAANRWREGSASVPELLGMLKDQSPIVRYWAAMSLGNLAGTVRLPDEALRSARTDSSPVVRVLVARILARNGNAKDALSTLPDALENGDEWTRLMAAIVLDEMDERARPALAVMQAEMNDKKKADGEGKYTVRVLNRAINDLLGTNNQVP